MVYISVLVFLSFISSGCFLQTNISSLENLKGSGLESISSDQPTFSVELSKTTVIKTSSDHDENSFITISLSRAHDSTVTFTINPVSTDATSSDYSLETATVTFAPGEITKQVKLTVKGRVGSQDWDKVVNLKVSPNISGFAQTEVAKDFTIKDSNALSLTVNPFYPTLGQHWNSYINGSLAIKVVSRYLRLKPENFPTEAACTGNNMCIHAGELKKVVVSNRKTCAGLSMQDSENAFEWRCSDAAAPAYFYSVGLKLGKGLKDLLLTTGTDWKNLSVDLIENNQTIASSSLTKWWTNSVFLYDSANINSGGAAPRITLSSAETIYVFKGNLLSRGININADGIALVTLPGSSVSSAGTPASVDCDLSDVGVDNCFINNMVKDRVWIEGAFTGAGSLPVISNQTFMDYTNNFRLHGSYISGGSSGIYSYSTVNDVFSDSTIVGGLYGIYNGYSMVSSYFDLKLSGQTAYGINPGNVSAFAKLLNVQMADIVGTAFSIWGQQLTASQFQISRIQGYAVDGYALYGHLNNMSLSSSTTGFSGVNTRPTLVNITSFGNSGNGFYFTRSMNQYATRLLSAGNAVGIFAEGTGGGSNVRLNDVAALDNSTTEIQFANNTSNYTFGNKLSLGRATTKCTFGAGTAGINIVGANCDPAAGDPLTVTSGLDANTILQGFTNDTINPQGATGAAGTLFANITNWFSFSTFSRSWVPWTASGIPDAALRGRCTSGTCGIYDTAVKTGAHGFKNYNGTFIANAACPAITKGSNAIDYSVDVPSSALQGVVEFLLDGTGDDDGICEANESCYFLPDLGANFFDLPSLNQTCIYDPDGSALTGITIYGKQ